MADATPVNSAPKTKKGASAGIPADVLAGIEAQAAEVVADVTAEAPFKVAGGVELESHKAVREDF